MVVGAVRHVDIRRSGSGNAGGTNAFRTQGVWFALGVVVIDIGKGALAAGLLPHWPLLGDPQSLLLQSLVCGFAAVIGHCYPLWYGFRGGQGAATAVGALLVIVITSYSIHYTKLYELGLHMVPVRLSFGDREYLDRVTLTSSEFYELLRNSPEAPLTSQPPAQDFARVYSLLTS